MAQSFSAAHSAQVRRCLMRPSECWCAWFPNGTPPTLAPTECGDDCRRASGGGGADRSAVCVRVFLARCRLPKFSFGRRSGPDSVGRHRCYDVSGQYHGRSLAGWVEPIVDERICGPQYWPPRWPSTSICLVKPRWAAGSSLRASGVACRTSRHRRSIHQSLVRRRPARFFPPKRRTVSPRPPHRC